MQLSERLKHPTLVDHFCGGGGLSKGTVRTINRFGYTPERTRLYGLNHDADSIATHSANFPWATHIHDSIENVEPREVLQGRKLLLMVGSPPCTHHANARGGKPREEQSRATPNHLLKWIAEGDPLVGVFENVPEFRTWCRLGSDGMPMKEYAGEFYHQWLDRISDLGYRWEDKILDAADFGAPQRRKRLFIQIRKEDVVDEDFRWPEPTHCDPKKLAPGRLPWRGAIEILDLSLETRSIFGRTRPLSVKTRARIARGIRSRGAFWEPLALAVEADPQTELARPVPLRALLDASPFETWPEYLRLMFTLGQQGGAMPHDITDPTASIAAGGAVSYWETVFQLPVDGPGGNGTNNPPKDIRAPLNALRASRTPHIVDTPIIVQSGGPEWSGAKPKDARHPLNTLLTREHLAVVDTPILVPAHGERPGQEPRFHDTLAPFPALPACRQPDLVMMQFIQKYNGNRGLKDIRQPLHAIACGDGQALFQVGSWAPEHYDYDALDNVLIDVRMRMLAIKELARGQVFPDDYVWHGKPRSIRKQIGNAVCVSVAEALTYSALYPILGDN